MVKQYAENSEITSLSRASSLYDRMMTGLLYNLTGTIYVSVPFIIHSIMKEIY